MEKNTSLYLDAIRFLAACLVVIYHTSGENITGGFLWQLNVYGHPSVIVFFVLSGYVIAFVADTKEKTLSDYLAARLSRLYSIIVPAIVITLICNEIGGLYISNEYNGPWNENEPNTYARYFAALLMLQNVWGLDLSPTNNGSFWSLSYEFFYYVLFAGIFYCKGFSRFAICTAAIVISGPKIIALAPIWWLGYVAYRLNTTQKIVIPAWLSVSLFSSGLFLLAIVPHFSELFRFQTLHFGDKVAFDYLIGLGFFIHLLGVPQVAKMLSYFLNIAEPTIKRMSYTTFSIYLFHLPIIRLTAGISPYIENPGSWQNILFIYVLTFSVIRLLGSPAERSKRWYKYVVLNQIQKLRLISS
ncbi:acyltransferase family protein [Vibrio ziniensis]|uniref:Acyltransferase n=1 Tax=Vibrio ziniensis TaxID=2711221 RepID=A0A6G7CNH4_9VIBR|nr:acyltransferase [Vibrio ziniensis]QIH43659.1 acyltransferase [Vibrio ziniensis]